jgi:uncharacterized protein
MAILRGFPPSNTISPSVRIAEKDLSFIAPDQSFHRAGLVGFASKGPIDIPTLIGTTRELHRIFGNPHPASTDPYLIYAADQYLLVANELYVVRVGEEDAVSDEAATIASVEVPASGSNVLIQSDSDGDSGSFVFTVDSFFKWRLNGITASKTLVVLAGTYTCAELADTLNDQLDTSIDGIVFGCSSNMLSVSTVFAYGPDATLELVSVQDAIYGPASVTGLGTGMTAAATTGSKDRYPAANVTQEWDFTGLTDLNLQIVIDGTDNVNIDNVVQVIDLAALEGNATLTTAAVVQEINDQITDGTIPGGFVASASANKVKLTTLHHGRDARLLVKSDSSAGAIFGFDFLTKTGTSPSGTTGDSDIETLAIVAGDNNSTGDVTFTVKADSAGIEGNSTSVVVTNNVREATFSLDVYSNGVQVESWGGLTKDQNSRLYVQTFLSLVSDYIRVDDNTAETASPLDGTYALLGGNDGIPSDPDEQDALLIGSVAGQSGLFALSEPEQIDIDLIAVPGHASTAVINALISLAEDRGDCLAIIDPPFGLTVNEIVHWQNGTHPLNTTRFDSDFAALYWPWVKIRDNHNRVDVWVPPSGSVMATIARSDFIAQPWFAPAGITRGVVPAISDVFSRPTLAERDTMYGNRNAINPIIQFPDVDGFVIWGQKTLQRRPTALDRVNVRRLMFVVEKRIRTASRQLLFDPHDDEFRERFVNLATGILSEIKIGRGITDYIIKADAEINTPDVVDRNEFRARIGIQPTRAVEFIFIEFSIHRTGSFAETSDTF